MEGSEVAAAIYDAIIKHHEAFSVELYGAEKSGLSQTRINQLVAEGFLKRDQLKGIQVAEMDVVAFTQRVAQVMNKVSDKDRSKKRKQSLAQWQKDVKEVAEAGARSSSGAPIELPEPPPVPVTQMSPSGEIAFVREPVQFTRAEKASYRQAIRRGGEFARGLGNQVGQDARTLVAEVWDGTKIKLEADPKLRQEMQTIIREKVSDAVAQRSSARKLASELGNATQDYARNWKRIARTELQIAYNEGVAIEAIEIFGEEARVARIVESDACSSCLRLFLDEKKKPIIFEVADLLSRGTNVGRQRDQWQPTLGPVHPYCRCDTQIVPPGMEFDEDGFFVPEGSD